MKFSILLLLLILWGAYYGYTIHLALNQLKASNFQLSKIVNEQKTTIDSLKSTLSAHGIELQANKERSDVLEKAMQKYYEDLTEFGKYFSEYDKELKKTLDNISKANQWLAVLTKDEARLKYNIEMANQATMLDVMMEDASKISPTWLFDGSQ